MNLVQAERELGVKFADGSDALKKAWKSAASTYHPDNQKTGNADKFKRAKEAYDFLSAYREPVRTTSTQTKDASWYYSSTKSAYASTSHGNSKPHEPRPESREKTLEERIAEREAEIKRSLAEMDFDILLLLIEGVVVEAEPKALAELLNKTPCFRIGLAKAIPPPHDRVTILLASGDEYLLYSVVNFASRSYEGALLSVFHFDFLATPSRTLTGFEVQELISALIHEL